MPNTRTIALKANWKYTLQSSLWIMMIAGTGIMLMIGSMLPAFFNSIEKRKGLLMNDWILTHLPSVDVSIPIFVIIWGLCAFTIVRSAVTPVIYIKYVWVLIFTTLLRIVTISLFALDPPTGLVTLSDPLTGVFYGHSNITHDLFFSGHTTSVYLMYLCLEKKRDKQIALAATLVLVVLLLLQHVHYTIDIIGAFVFVYPLYRMVNAMIPQQIKHSKLN